MLAHKSVLRVMCILTNDLFFIAYIWNILIKDWLCTLNCALFA